MEVDQLTDANLATSCKRASQAQLIDAYADVFTGIGEFNKPYHIKLKENAEPSIQPPHKVPFARLSKLSSSHSWLNDTCV